MAGSCVPFECDDSNTIPWDGCTNHQISEFKVNTFQFGYQRAPVVGASGESQFMVGYESNPGFFSWFFGYVGQDGCKAGLFGRTYSAECGSSAEETKTGVGGYNDGYPELAVLPDGTAALAWIRMPTGLSADGETCVAKTGYSVVVQMLDAAGNLVGEELAVGELQQGGVGWPPDFLGRFALVAVPSSSPHYVVLWIGGKAPTNTIQGRAVLPNGEMPAGQVTLGNWNSNVPLSLAATATAEHLQIVWHQVPVTGTEVIAVRWYESVDSPAVGQLEVPLKSSGFKAVAPRIAAISPDSSVLVWSDRGVGKEDADIFGVALKTEGFEFSQSFQLNTYSDHDQKQADVVGLNDTTYVVVWASAVELGETVHETASDIRLQMFKLPTELVGPEIEVNRFLPHIQNQPRVGALPDGTFLIVWQSWYQEQEWDAIVGVFAQAFNINGERILCW